MLFPEDLRLAALHQLPRKEAILLIGSVKGLPPYQLALLWEANNLRPKINLEHYAKTKEVQSNQ